MISLTLLVKFRSSLCKVPDRVFIAWMWRETEAKKLLSLSVRMRKCTVICLKLFTEWLKCARNWTRQEDYMSSNMVSVPMFTYQCFSRHYSFDFEDLGCARQIHPPLRLRSPVPPLTTGCLPLVLSEHTGITHCLLLPRHNSTNLLLFEYIHLHPTKTQQARWVKAYMYDLTESYQRSLLNELVICRRQVCCCL